MHAKRPAVPVAGETPALPGAAAGTAAVRSAGLRAWGHPETMNTLAIRSAHGPGRLQWIFAPAQTSPSGHAPPGRNLRGPLARQGYPAEPFSPVPAGGP